MLSYINLGLEDFDWWAFDLNDINEHVCFLTKLFFTFTASMNLLTFLQTVWVITYKNDNETSR